MMAGAVWPTSLMMRHQSLDEKIKVKNHVILALLGSVMSLPNCPKCQSEYTYEDNQVLICPECSHEWVDGAVEAEQEEQIKDAHGQLLQDGDSVSVIKDLKIKGSSSVVKVGTKVKNIRLILDATDGHNIDCKVDGIGAIKLKSEYVKKA